MKRLSRTKIQHLSVVELKEKSNDIKSMIYNIYTIYKEIESLRDTQNFLAGKSK